MQRLRLRLAGALSEADGKVPTYLDLLKVTSSTVVEGLKSNSQ